MDLWIKSLETVKCHWWILVGVYHRLDSISGPLPHWIFPESSNYRGHKRPKYSFTQKQNECFRKKFSRVLKLPNFTIFYEYKKVSIFRPRPKMMVGGRRTKLRSYPSRTTNNDDQVVCQLKFRYNLSITNYKKKF